MEETDGVGGAGEPIIVIAEELLTRAQMALKDESWDRAKDLARRVINLKVAPTDLRQQAEFVLQIADVDRDEPRSASVLPATGAQPAFREHVPTDEGRPVRSVASGARKKGPLTISPGLLQIFYSYAEADAEDKRALQSALVSVVRDYGIDEKDRDSIDPGRPVGVETQQMFRDSDIVVLLITSHYMAERWDEDAQVVGALLESARGGSVVVPVLMRPTDLPEPLSNVQLLPRNRQPVTAWPSQDEAFKQIAAGIRNLCEDLERTSGRPHTIGKRRHAG